MDSTAPSALSGLNADFIAELYASWLRRPDTVAADWAAFFAGLRDDERTALSELRGASWAPAVARVIGVAATETAKPSKAEGKVAGTPSSEQVMLAARDSVRAMNLIRSHRVRGHLVAAIDPLGLMQRAAYAELEPAFHGFNDTDWERPIFLGGLLGLQQASLREILAIARATYTGAIGFEYMHIIDPKQCDWLRERIENRQLVQLPAERRWTLERLTAAEGLEKFLATKFQGVKRFGLEGGEATLPAIEAAIATAATMGLQEVVIGMAHRGRLNMLTNLLQKSFTALFAEFKGASTTPDTVLGSGDVKYHLGASCDREFSGQSIHLTMNANPSHLEAVNPVVAGRVRAKQFLRRGESDDASRRMVMPLLIHGDAAFAGQGVVAETLAFSELKGYRTGGTLHVVINNQIGFTTAPAYSRSGPYCTDIAKSIQAPIFHVNGDDPDAVMFVARLAAEYRQTFLHDVVLDIVCYRRHGHNEADEPAFTQPRMYGVIRDLPSTRTLYAQRLTAAGVVSAAEATQMEQDFTNRLQQAFDATDSYKPNKADWLEGHWQGVEARSNDGEMPVTGTTIELLREVGRGISRVPDGFQANPKILRQLEAKWQAVESGQGIDWATAEALAFGTLCLEGHNVRLSGQDCGRGTFSQRHAAIYDQQTEKRYRPLNNLRPDQKGRFWVFDSPLSEYAVLGFEYGCSLADPNGLALWEAQFGDFANGAQIMIDQFISCAETKWQRLSALTMLLPHGYEGQGPEHSSARLERFLQLCAEGNWQVANCSTPASYFHILRRQMKSKTRKPLVLMTPKSLLRHKLCVSDLATLGPGTRFQPVIGEVAPDMVPDGKMRRAVICSGKVYYDLLEARTAKGLRDVALIRLEEFYPFPARALAQELVRYPKADIIWCQEEPENMGGWHFLDRRLEAVLADIGHKAGRPVYAGRAAAASPATGSAKRHATEQAALVEQALGITAAARRATA